MTVIFEKKMKLRLQDLEPSVVVREDDQRMTALGKSSRKTNNLVPDELLTVSEVHLQFFSCVS